MIFLLTVTSPLEVSSALVNHWLQARSTRTCANECWITAIGIAVSGWTVYPYLAKLSDFWVDIQRLTMLYCQLHEHILNSLIALCQFQLTRVLSNVVCVLSWPKPESLGTLTTTAAITVTIND